MRLYIGQSYEDRANSVDKWYVTRSKKFGSKHIIEGTHDECMAYINNKLTEADMRNKAKFDAFGGVLISKEEYKNMTKALRNDDTKTWRALEYKGQIRIKVTDCAPLPEGIRVIDRL